MPEFLADYDKKMTLIKYFIIIMALQIPTRVLAEDYSKFTGTAKNEMGEVVYYEAHRVEHNDRGQVVNILTRYLQPNEGKEVFARLESTFNKSNFLPESLFEDFRNSHIEKTLLDIENNNLTIIHSNKTNKKTSKEVLELSNKMVMGQGYHNYIVKNLDSFKVNEKRVLDFVVPAKKDYYQFNLTYLGKKNSKTKLVTFRLDITNWILRLFARKIEVDYNPKTKRLMAYRGLTNIESEEGDAQSLRITYKYPEDEK